MTVKKGFLHFLLFALVSIPWSGGGEMKWIELTHLKQKQSVTLVSDQKIISPEWYECLSHSRFLKLNAKKDEIYLRANGIQELVIPFDLINESNNTQSFCFRSFSYSPLIPMIAISISAEKGIREIGPRHGSGFGPDYYPDPKQDKTTITQFELPPYSRTSILARSRDLNRFYEIKSPTEVLIKWETTLLGGHSGGLKKKWSEIKIK